MLNARDVVAQKDSLVNPIYAALHARLVVVTTYVSIDLLQDKSIVEAKLSSRGSVLVAGMSQVFGVKVVSMLQVLVVDQTFVPFVHRTSVVSVLAPMERMLHLMCRHCSLPPVQTASPYLTCKLLLLTSCTDCCSLLPVRADCCSLLPEQTAAPYFLSRLLLVTS
ncbi:hypothetical protein Tco_1546819 [Tanacetum coccineum]